MTIAGRFADALLAVTDPAIEEPDLLPERLSRACARMLAVDGAGLSVMDPEGRRIPLGASGEAASCAERLQFTVGGGPCMAAQDSGRPVFAMPDELRRRWAPFADLLAAQTGYRAVVALPLRQALSGSGAIDLYFRRPEDVPDLDVFDALAAADLVTFALSEATVWSDWSAARGPDWLHGPAARRRAGVWQALGALNLALHVDTPAALALLRAHARLTGRTADAVADDLLAGRLNPETLRSDGSRTPTVPNSSPC